MSDQIVYVVTEEGDIHGVYSTEEKALRYVADNTTDIEIFDIEAVKLDR